MAENAVRLSLTLNATLHGLASAVLTPKGLMKPSKGSFSSLLETLVTRYLEETVGAEMYDILGYCNEHGVDIPVMQKHFAALKEAE